MSRSAWRWSIVLCLLLVGAYFAWTVERSPHGAGAPVTILDLKPEAIDRVALRTEKREVVVAQKKDAHGRYFEVTLTEHLAPKADDTQAPSKTGAKADTEAGDETKPGGGAKAEASGGEAEAKTPDDAQAAGASKTDEAKEKAEKKEAKGETKVRRFAGGRAAERLFERLAPLTALRVLEDVPDERLEKLGLKPGEATFEITRGERTWRFSVGGKTFGAARRYLLEEGSHRVYLVEATALRNLEGAERQLLERSVLGKRRQDLVEVSVRAGDKSQRMLQKNRDDRRAAFWAFAAKPDEKSSVAESWVEKLFRLRVDAYVDTIPDGVEEACRITAKTEEGEVEITLYRGAGKDGQPEVYAESSYLRLPVKVYRQSGIEVIDDLSTLFVE